MSIHTGGVTCACAEETKAKAKPEVDCIAHESCPYLKNGECSCDHGKCVSSQNKKLCLLAEQVRHAFIVMFSTESNADDYFDLQGQCDCAVSHLRNPSMSRASQSAADLILTMLMQAGACKKMLEIKKECSAAPGCDCVAGECKKAAVPIS